MIFKSSNLFPQKHLKLSFTIFFALTLSNCFSQDSTAFIPQRWNIHYQSTVIWQHHPEFNSPYSGSSSMNSKAESAMSVSSTAYLGFKVFKHTSIYFNPEIMSGSGLSMSKGIAGFPNGETFRIDDPSPHLYLARLYVKQYIPLDNSEYDTIRDEANQLTELIPIHRLGIAVGKFCIADFYDHNSISHDPRMDFMNWTLMSNGAWDYPANTRGYTAGGVIEYIHPKFEARISCVLVPTYANGPILDYNFSKARSYTFEIENHYSIFGKPGIFRTLLSYTLSKAPKYSDLIANYITKKDSLNATTSSTYDGKKFGIGLNLEQELSNYLSLFSRFSWNDGQYATWAFTEVDQSLSAGLRLKGDLWHRKTDHFGLAFVANGISKSHQDFYALGGIGFMIGDGKLPHYASEKIIETYYQLRATNFLWLSVDYQFVKNPGYNPDRGAIHIFGVRAHFEI